MAKKKSNPQSNNTTDDAASEKLHNLQSLNSLLLKETVERRHQVDSLTQANSCLESELTRCVSELNALNELNEQTVRLEIERGVEYRVLEVRAGEMVKRISDLELDLSRVVDEKKAVELVKESKESEIGLMASRLSKVECEIGEVRIELSRVCEERDEIRCDRVWVEDALRANEAEKKSVEAKVGLVLKEKELVEKRLVEANGLVDGLKMDLDKMSERKMSVEEDRDLLLKKVNELREGKAELVNKVADLEKKCVASLDNEANVRARVDVLEKEKEKMGVEIRKVNDEKSLVAKDLGEALNNLRKVNVDISRLVSEQTEINDARNRAETDVIKLKQQVEELENAVEKLEKQSVVRIDRIKQLESENSRHVAAYDRVTNERNSAVSSLDAETLKVKRLSDTVSKMENDVEDMKKKLSKMQKETEKLVAEKKGLENKRQALENDIQTVKKSLAKTQKEHDDAKSKLRVSEANTKRMLKILKKTSLICNSKGDGDIDKETEFGEEIKYHVTEVEAIRKAFKDKESIMDEMKKQVEQLKVRVAKADKGKSFWTIVSSATTFLAAVSLAYAARVGF
ncbi:uncharacterized protein LOC143560765 [Bidens hawaiensis]|uniref:uncharacterized protein LOC143560765 n=1 Tax=Bidens hawaiensis TaxID=980011 RepID=UPI00404B4B31